MTAAVAAERRQGPHDGSRQGHRLAMAACKAWLYVAAMFHDGVRGLLLLVLLVLSWSR